MLRIYLLGLDLYKAGKGSRHEPSKEYDGWMGELAVQFPDCTYLDICSYEPLHRDDIYVAGNSRYNQTGYNMCADFFKEVLKDELARY